jgi:hypothetical protein
MNDVVVHNIKVKSNNRKLTGRRVLFTLAKSGQTSLDELTMVALTFGLKATDVAEAIAARFAPLSNNHLLV